MAGELISVIIPVYNTVSYLPRCAEALLAQTYPDFELIFVDDGSQDGSGALCDALADRDARIRVIHQPNGGVSRARNAGLDAARGDLLCFVDSDDVPKPDYLSFLYQQLKNTGASLSACSYVSFGGDKELRALPLPKSVLSPREYLLYALSGQYGLPLTVWGWLFPASGDLRFAEDLHYGEDSLYLCRALAAAGSVAYEAAPLYRYDIGRDGGTFRRRTLAKALSNRTAWERIAALFPKEEELCAQFMRILCDLSLQCVRLAHAEKNAAEEKRLKKEAAHYYAQLRKSPFISRKDKLRLRLLLFTPVAGAALWEKLRS